MKYFKALVMMQLKDKLDFGFLSSKKKTITKVVFFVLRLIIIAAVSYIFFSYSAQLKLFSLSGIVPQGVITIIYTIIFLLSLLACTFGLVKTLYFASDNAVLVTMPVSNNIVFFSKLTVYYVFELVRSYSFTVPLFFGYCLASGVPVYTYVWMLIAFIFVSALPVVIGALLSIPFSFLSMFLKRHSYINTAFFLIVVGFFIWLVVGIINLIPENIDLINQWPIIRTYIDDFIVRFNAIAFPLAEIVYMLLGRYTQLAFHLFTLETLLVFLSILATIAIVLICVCLLVKPLFLRLTATPFEYGKNEVAVPRQNKKRHKYPSILRKEFLLNLRNATISYNYVGVYIAIPILILLLNKVFSVMYVRELGLQMSYAFNVLIIILPLLASNAMIATMYSIEGRAGYIKKTKPLNLTMPLLCKLFYNLVLSTISVIVTIIVLQNYVEFDIINIIFLFFAVMLLNVGHMLWCAELDIMNPQNEQYATTGDQIDNPNEKKATVIAFIISVIIFAFSFKLFTEDVAMACLKLFLIGALFFAVRLFLFVNRVKVYYKGN